MPWDKKRVDGEICVYKRTTGEVLHCYSGEDAEVQANKYLSALYMHSGEEAKKEYDLLYAPPEGEESTVHVQKQGNGYWITTVSTAALKDHEGEVFDAECIDYDLKQAKRLGDYPEFRVFHSPSLGIGRVEKMQRVGIFAVDQGMSYTDPFSLAVCEKMLVPNDGKYRCSRGFRVLEASGTCPACDASLVVKEEHFIAGFMCPSCKSYHSAYKTQLKDLHYLKARTFDVTVTDKPANPWTGVGAIKLPLVEDGMTKKELKEKLLKAGVPEEEVDARLEKVNDAKLKELDDLPFAEVLKEFKPDGEDEGDQVFVLDPEVLKDFTDIVRKEVKAIVKDEVRAALEGLSIDVPDMDIQLKELPGLVELKELVEGLAEKVDALLQKDETRLKQLINGGPRAAKLRIQRYKADDAEESDEDEEDEEDEEEPKGKGKKLPPWLKKSLEVEKEDTVVFAGADGRVSKSATEFLMGGGE